MADRDENQLTEEEFLAAYKPGAYPRPSCTADLALFYKPDGNRTEILLIKRARHPGLGKWALPGGFVNPDETVEAAAARELREETGVGFVLPVLLGVFSEPGRDPRGWTITSLFGAAVSDKPPARAADDAREARWFTLDYELSEMLVSFTLSAGDTVLSAKCGYERRDTLFGPDYALTGRDSGGLAFDHAKLIALAILKSAPIIFRNGRCE